MIMEYFMAFIKANDEILTVAALVISGITLVMLIINLLRTRTWLKKYNKMMHGAEGKDLEGMLEAHLESVNRVLHKTSEVENAYKAVRKIAEKSIQNVGVIRFNAFDDTGSDLSFAVALLDYHGDGVVISTIFGRDESRTYAKPIAKGVSSHHLSSEEEKAIAKALEGQIIK